MSDIFTEQDKTNPENTNVEAGANTADEIVKKLMEITRPDGTPKYTDPLAALDALKASQEHIQRIESENATFAEKMKEVESLKETIERLRANNTNENSNPQTKDEGGRSVEAAEELVSRLLNEKLSEREAVNAAVSNVKKVQDILVKKFGGEQNAVDQITAKAKQLNITTKQLKELSAQSPQLVLELFGSSTATPSPNNSSVNLNGYSPADNDEIEPPERSVLSGPGATHKKQVEYFNKIRANVNKRLGVET